MKENGGFMGFVVENAAVIKAVCSSAFLVITAASLHIASLIKEKQRKESENKKIAIDYSRAIYLGREGHYYNLKELIKRVKKS